MQHALKFRCDDGRDTQTEDIMEAVEEKRFAAAEAAEARRLAKEQEYEAALEASWNKIANWDKPPDCHPPRPTNRRAERTAFYPKDKTFSELTPHQQAAVITLGWDATSWDINEDHGPFDRNWKDLSSTSLILTLQR